MKFIVDRDTVKRFCYCCRPILAARAGERFFCFCGQLVLDCLWIEDCSLNGISNISSAARGLRLIGVIVLDDLLREVFSFLFYGKPGCCEIKNGLRRHCVIPHEACFLISWTSFKQRPSIATTTDSISLSLRLVPSLATVIAHDDESFRLLISPKASGHWITQPLDHAPICLVTGREVNTQSKREQLFHGKRNQPRKEKCGRDNNNKEESQRNLRYEWRRERGFFTTVLGCFISRTFSIFSRLCAYQRYTLSNRIVDGNKTPRTMVSSLSVWRNSSGGADGSEARALMTTSRCRREKLWAGRRHVRWKSYRAMNCAILSEKFSSLVFYCTRAS